jgi:hypothetical protein
MNRATPGVIALALVAGLGAAAAQSPPQSTIGAANPADQPPRAEQQSPDVTAGRPSTASPTSSLDQQSKQAVQSKSGQGGKEEPSSHAPSEKPMNTAVLVDGRLAVPDAPADGQTVPAKFSERNAALDRLPTMAIPLPLSEAEQRRIYESVSETRPAPGNMAAKPADVLPQGIEMRELPNKITDEIPAVRDLKYAKIENKVLLVQPSNRIVVGEIER